jgi:hypothetical protein
LFFLLLMLAHLAHVFEEVWGRFFLISSLGGLGLFLIINWILFAIVVLILYLILQRRSIGLKLGLVYAAIMTLNGLGHNMATIISGRYFDGFAGGFTGIAMVILGSILFMQLLKEIRIGRQI